MNIIQYRCDVAAMSRRFGSGSSELLLSGSEHFGCGFYFHDAAVQTTGVDDPVKQRADTRIRLANDVRDFPSKIDGLRSPRLNLWDISVIKRVAVNDRVRAQFHVELLNAFNRTVYANPNTDPTNADFGKVTSQTNLPRDIQLALKLLF